MTKPAKIPTRPVLIAELRGFIKLLESTGAQAERMAPLLASRGFPTGTLGDGGSRGNSEHTSTERAAAHRDEWADADEKLARLYVELFALTGAGAQFITSLASRAASDEQHEGEGLARTGTNGGWCMACARWVPGTADDRIRSGFCNACRMAWNRKVSDDPHADRAEFIRHRPKHHAEDERPAPIDPKQHRVVERTMWSNGETVDLLAEEPT